MPSKKRVNITNIQLVKERSVLYEGRRINNPTNVYELLKDFLSNSDREKFIVICLNTKHEPINITTVSIGTMSSTLVNPADVMKSAILSNSNKIIVAHNHPSGKPDPSQDDINITDRLKNAGKILGIDVLDHVIVAGTRYYSFLENKFLFEKTKN